MPLYLPTDQASFQPTPDDFLELDEAHERDVPPGWYRCRVVMVNLKGVQQVLFVDRPSPPWRKGWNISFEGKKWRALDFDGIYKVTDFSSGGYDENISDLRQTSCRYELREFMGIPANIGAISVPPSYMARLGFILFVAWIIKLIAFNG
ncbi:MAG: hypothetical protein GY938_13080 [Ketobacter sp.]|nr:hypothetical protein [Ketobacter sp.]